MALQLKNKVDKEKPESDKNKKGKYRRKRDVFGKRTARFGLVGTIIALIIAFAVVKTVFTLSQNKKQKNIDEELTKVNENIKKYRRELSRKATSYDNVGELIATLPATFDQQATSLDLDRIITLSNFTESVVTKRSIQKDQAMPFECSVSTVKAVKINLSLVGKKESIKDVYSLIDFLCDYSHENFYYIENLSYANELTQNRITVSVEMYTFYNDVELTTPTDNTNTNTTTK